MSEDRRAGRSYSEQYLYDIIFKGLSAFAETIDITRIDHTVDVQKIFEEVMNDNPQFFYFDRNKIRIVSSPFKRQLLLARSMRKSQSLKALNEMNDIAKSLTADALSASKIPFEQLLIVYEYLQKSIEYDQDELLANSKDRMSNPNAHNLYGALIERKAVCDGFAAAFQFVVQRMGYRCVLVSGSSTYMTAIKKAHAWNMIEIGGGYYHVDLTWAANFYADHKEYSYDWFLLDDDSFISDHNWDLNATPIASDNSLSYHRRKGLFANNEADIIDIFTNEMKLSNPIRVRCSENVWSPKPLEEYLSQLLIETALKYHAKVKIIYNWNEKNACFFGKLVNCG